MSNSVTAPAESSLGRASLVVTQLGNAATEVVLALGNFIDDLWKKSTEFAKISNEVHRVHSTLAMELGNFSSDLSELRDYYASIYRMTKAMVEFGMGEKVIPYIISLIEEEKYRQAFDEIKSFIRILSERINKIVEKLDDYEENKVTILQEQLRNLSCKHEEAKQDLDASVEEGRKAVCYRLGKNTVFYTVGATGIFLIGSKFGVAQLEHMRNSPVGGDQVISFVTEQGIQTFTEIISTFSAFDDLKVAIEQNAISMRDNIHNFHTTLNKLKSQISCIITSIENLTEYEEELHHQFKDELKSDNEPNMDGNSVIEWQNTKITLNEMLGVFKHLQKQVIEKEISWTQLHD